MEEEKRGLTEADLLLHFVHYNNLIDLQNSLNRICQSGSTFDLLDNETSSFYKLHDKVRNLVCEHASAIHGAAMRTSNEP